MALKIRRRDQNVPQSAIKVKIKKDDTVKVIAGRDKGKTGRVLRRRSENRESAGRRRQHGEAPHAAESVEAGQGRHRGAGKLDFDFERHDRDLGRRGHAHRLPDGADRRGGAAGADRQKGRRDSRQEGIRYRRHGLNERQYQKQRSLPALSKEFGYKNVMAVPKIEKISLNIGMGEATQNTKLIDGAVNEMTQIAGQSR